jgi:hypothetical protein
MNQNNFSSPRVTEGELLRRHGSAQGHLPHGSTRAALPHGPRCPRRRDPDLTPAAGATPMTTPEGVTSAADPTPVAAP